MTHEFLIRCKRIHPSARRILRTHKRLGNGKMANSYKPITITLIDHGCLRKQQSNTMKSHCCTSNKIRENETAPKKVSGIKVSIDMYLVCERSNIISFKRQVKRVYIGV